MRGKMAVTALIALIVGSIAIAPVIAQVEPGSADEKSAADVLSESSGTSVAYELFDERLDEFLEENESVALFAPNDDALEDVAPEELSDDEVDELFTRHVSTGLVTQAPIEFVDWFATADGERIQVALEEDGDEERVVLDEEATVIEAVPTANGIVYVIDDSL